MDIEILARLTDRGQFPSGSDFTEWRSDLLRQKKHTAKSSVTRSQKPAEIDKAAIAAALAGVAKPAYLYAMMTVCEDEKAAGELIAIIAAGVQRLLVHRYGDQHRDKPDLCMGITNIIMFDRVGGMRCDACQGTQFVAKDICRRCKGSGWRRLNDSERARFLSKDPSNYSKFWKQKVEKLEQDYSFVISGWIDDVEKRLAKNLLTTKSW